jgi:hypothetical protein
MRHFRLWSLLVGAICLVIMATPIEVAQAASVSLVDQGNCNNSVPHGWSWTDWSSQAYDSSGSVHGQLQWYWDSTWMTMMDKSATVNYQANGDASVDNYYGVSEPGSGPWKEQGWHWASFFSGVTYMFHQYSC